MENLSKIKEELNNRIPESVKSATDKTNRIVDVVFEEVKDICKDYNIPVDYNKIQRIIDENVEFNYRTMNERIHYIVDCIDEEISYQETKAGEKGLLTEEGKYEIELNSFEKSESYNGKSTIDDTNKIINQLKEDLTEIKEHAAEIARQSGFEDKNIDEFIGVIDAKIDGLEDKTGNEVYAMLRQDKMEMIEEVSKEYDEMKENLSTIEEESKSQEEGKVDSFRDSLGAGISLEKQADFAKEMNQKIEEERKQNSNEKDNSLREDVIW